MADENVHIDDTDGNKENKVQANIKPGDTTVNVDNMIPKSRFDQINLQKKEAIEALAKVADSLAEDVPEECKSIIPQQLSPADKIDWIRKAQQSGFFNKQANDGLDTKKGSGVKPKPDYDKMQPEDMLKSGYSTK